MTSNQIAYWNLQEQIRTNKAKEAETNRHNLVTESTDIYDIIDNPTTFANYIISGGDPRNIVDGVNQIAEELGIGMNQIMNYINDFVSTIKGTNEDGTQKSVIERISDWITKAGNSIYESTTGQDADVPNPDNYKMPYERLWDTITSIFK